MNATATLSLDEPNVSENHYAPSDDECEALRSSENTVVSEERKNAKKSVIRERRMTRQGVIVVVVQATSTTKTTTKTTTRTVLPDGIDDQIPVFLETVYSIAAQGKIRVAMDIVFRRINKLLNNGDFRSCDDILMQVDVDRLPSTVLVGFLSITLSASNFLVARPAFFSKVHAKILVQKGPQATATLLDKYDGR